MWRLALMPRRLISRGGRWPKIQNGDRISEVNETSYLVHAFVIGDEQVRSTGDSQTFLCEGDEEEHVDLIDETRFREQRLADQQRSMSFTRTYKAEQTHKRKLEYMMEQVLKRQQKMCAVLDEKFDSVYSDLHDKFETLSDNFKKLDTQVAHNAEFVRRDEGFLPGRTDTNLRRQVCAVLLRSGKRLTLGIAAITSAEKPP